MILIGENIAFADLNKTQQAFFNELDNSEPVVNGLAIFKREGNTVHFIADLKISQRLNARFEKEAPAGFYRGGIVVFVKWNDYYLVAPDERYRWFKAVPTGQMRLNEGIDPFLAAKRELTEEIFILSMAKLDSNQPKLRTCRYLPEDMTGDSYNANLDLTVEKIVSAGELKQIGYHFNEKNKAFEVLYEWDISSISEPFTISLNESWFAGGNSGVSVYAADKQGKIAGVFSGQQGFLPLNKFGIHETMKMYLEIPD